MEILETFLQVFCFPRSCINENGGNIKITQHTYVHQIQSHLILVKTNSDFFLYYALKIQAPLNKCGSQQSHTTATEAKYHTAMKRLELNSKRNI